MSIEFLIDLGQVLLSGRRAEPAPSRPGAPLIVALHGGSYSSNFFDVPGYSLLDRALMAGCPVVAFDRPGYGESTLSSRREGVLEENAERLDAGIAHFWRHREAVAPGVVLIGHSIGGAVAILIAARDRQWPLLGIAVSGIGMIMPPDGAVYEGDQGEAPAERMPVPADIKNALMFGPPGTYAEDAPALAATANQPVVLREIAEINMRWPGMAQAACARVRVPVHYRHGEHDVVWSNERLAAERFQRAFANAPQVDAAIVEAAGHSIDFHHAGRAFQEEQIAFAIACARDAPVGTTV